MLHESTIRIKHQDIEASSSANGSTLEVLAFSLGSARGLLLKEQAKA
jgi:hypothetical protein